MTDPQTKTAGTGAVLIPRASFSTSMGLLGLILVIVLVLLLVGAIPVGRRNRRQGAGLGGTLGTILMIVLILWLLGVI